MAKKTKTYSLTLDLGGKHYSSVGETALEALRAMTAPAKFTNKGVITVTYETGEKTVCKTRVYSPQQLKRLFYTSPVFQAIQAKTLNFGLE